MLKHCLVSPAPILNPSVPLKAQRYRLEGEEHGQDQINPRIIFTCKLFYEAGLPLLYGHNVFMYTDSWDVFTYTLPRCDVKGCQKSGIENSSSPSPYIDHPPGAPCRRNSAFQTHATNIHMRFPRADDSDFLDECEDLLPVVDRFTNLRTFQLDFLNVYEGYEDDDWDLINDNFWTKGFQSAVRKTLRKLQDPNRPAGALKELVLTGLPQNDMGLYIVKHYTRLLAPHGRIGVGWGAKGRRYGLVHATTHVTKRDDLELLCMSVEEVQKWVARESETMGISRSEWLVAEQEPESDLASP